MKVSEKYHIISLQNVKVKYKCLKAVRSVLEQMYTVTSHHCLLEILNPINTKK